MVGRSIIAPVIRNLAEAGFSVIGAWVAIGNLLQAEMVRPGLLRALGSNVCMVGLAGAEQFGVYLTMGCLVKISGSLVYDAARGLPAMFETGR